MLAVSETAPAKASLRGAHAPLAANRLDCQSPHAPRVQSQLSCLLLLPPPHRRPAAAKKGGRTAAAVRATRGAGERARAGGARHAAAPVPVCKAVERGRRLRGFVRRLRG